MSKQLALSAAASVFAMSALALFAPHIAGDGERGAAPAFLQIEAQALEIPAPADFFSR